MAMKPIPKYVGILLIVGAVGYGLSHFLPKEMPKAAVVEQVRQEPEVRVQAPRPEPRQDTALEAANRATSSARQEAKQPVEQSSVTNGGRGMDALMKAGQK